MTDRAKWADLPSRGPPPVILPSVPTEHDEHLEEGVKGGGGLREPENQGGMRWGLKTWSCEGSKFL